MKARITVLSSMATRQLLAELAAPFESDSDCQVAIESIGGLDAVRRVRAGEAWDVIVLASDVIDQLTTAGRIAAGSKIDLVRSGVAVAVRSGAPKPGIASEEAVKKAVQQAARIAYSTGPSGVYLAKLFERWGIAEEIRTRLVVAPPGVPVGSIVASGGAELGFQQLSELMPVAGIDVIGPLPAAIQVITTFSAGRGVESVHLEPVRRLLSFLASPAATEAKRRNWLEPASSSA
jgi:molybdate transport system substrate-binding protein